MKSATAIAIATTGLTVMLTSGTALASTTVQECVDQIEMIQTDLNDGAGFDCDGIVLIAGRKRDNTAQTCDSLNSKLDGAIEKLENPNGPKKVDAFQKLQDFIDSLETKSGQGKIEDGPVTTVQGLIDDAKAAQGCISDL